VEWEELVAAVERAATRNSGLSYEETREKLERGFLQSERGEVCDGEKFTAGLLAELDELEQAAQRMSRYVLTTEGQRDLNQIRDYVLAEGGFRATRYVVASYRDNSRQA
jgi:hypothetical protein